MLLASGGGSPGTVQKGCNAAPSAAARIAAGAGVTRVRILHSGTRRQHQPQRRDLSA